jgi:hypothetical protein
VLVLRVDSRTEQLIVILEGVEEFQAFYCSPVNVEDRVVVDVDRL